MTSKPPRSTHDEMRDRLAAVVLFSVPDDTPITKARELVERWTDIALEAIEELAVWESS